MIFFFYKERPKLSMQLSSFVPLLLSHFLFDPYTNYITNKKIFSFTSFNNERGLSSTKMVSMKLVQLVLQIKFSMLSIGTSADTFKSAQLTSQAASTTAVMFSIFSSSNTCNNRIAFEPWSVKRGHTTAAKCINPCQSILTVLAHMV